MSNKNKKSQKQQEKQPTPPVKPVALSEEELGLVVGGAGCMPIPPTSNSMYTGTCHPEGTPA